MPRMPSFERLRKIVPSIQRNDYYSAVSTIVKLVKKWGNLAVEKASAAAVESDVKSNGHLDAALKEPFQTARAGDQP
ncbi:hypothetical protein V8E36_002166 [Tilletia maclaganii]